MDIHLPKVLFFSISLSHKEQNKIVQIPQDRFYWEVITTLLYPSFLLLTQDLLKLISQG